MPINVGEVEAVLSARDRMSPEFVQAANSVQALRNLLRQFGDEAGPELTRVELALTRAEAEFVRLRDSGAGAVASIEKVGPAAGTSAARLAELTATTEKGVLAAKEQAAALKIEAEASEAVTAAATAQAAAMRSAAAAGASMVNSSATPSGGFGSLGAANSAALDNAMGTNKKPALSGQAFMNEMASAAGTPLTDTQRIWMNQLNEMNMLTATNAEKVGVAAVQYKAFKEELEAGTTTMNRAGQSMNQMQGFMSRLVEYYIFMGTIRIVGGFIADLITGAEDMRNLSEQTKVSTGLLQDFKYTGDVLGIEFTKTTSAIQFFDKAIGAVKATTGDALLSIGLSFNQLFAMSPDDRLKAVVAGLAGIEDPATRARLSVALFGTDGIDPVITKLDAMSKALDGSGRKMGDGTVNALADTLKLYRTFASDAGEIAGSMIDSGQKMVAGMFAPIFAWLSGNSAGYEEMVDSDKFRKAQLAAKWVKEHGSLVGFDADREDAAASRRAAAAAAPPTPVPAMGQAYIDQLKAERGELDNLTDAQIRQLMQLDKMNILTADNAARLSVSTLQFKEFTDQLREMTTWQKTYDTALAKHLEISKEVDESDQSWRKTLAGIEGRTPPFGTEYLTRDQVIARGEDMLKKGVTPEKVAAELGLVPEQVKAMGEAIKYETEKLKEYAKAIDDLTKIQLTSTWELFQYYSKLGQNVPGFELGDYFPSRFYAGSRLPQRSYDFMGPVNQNPNYDRQPVFTAPDSAAMEEAARNRMKNADYGFTDEFGDLPRAMEEAFGRSGNIGRALSDIAKRVGRDFSKDMATSISNGLSVDGDLIGIGIMSGISVGLVSDFRKPGGISNVISGALSTGIGASIDLSNDGKNLAQALAGGFTTGITTFGVAMAVSALTSFARYIFRDRVPEDIMRDAGEKFGAAFSDALVKKIREDVKRTGDEVSAELLHLADIIKETPVTSQNVEMYLQRVADLFVKINQGTISTTEAAKVIDDVFSQLLAKSTATTGQISQQMRDLIEFSSKFGLNSEQIAAWRKTEGMEVLSGWSAVAMALPLKEWSEIAKKIADLTKELADRPGQKDKEEELKRLLEQRKALAIANKQELEDTSEAILGAFAIAMATGTSYYEALKAQQPTILALRQAYLDLGISMEDSGLKFLFIQAEMMKNNPSLFAGIDGLTKAMIAQANLGVNTEESFRKQEEAAVRMYTRLQREAELAGGSTADALLPMQAFLHAAQREADRLGIPLSDAIANMIKMSKELGIWDENAGDAVDPMKELAAAIKELVAWLRQIPTSVTTTVTVDYRTKGTPPDIPPGPSEPGGDGESPRPPDRKGPPPTVPALMSQGGIVRNSGRVLPFRSGTDTEAAMLTPGEGVVNIDGMDRLGADGLRALNSGGAISGSQDTFHINMTVVTKATNARELAEEARAPGGLFDQFINEILNNRRDRGKILSRGLRVS